MHIVIYTTLLLSHIKSPSLLYEIIKLSQYKKSYTNSANMNITPTPDRPLRVYTAYVPLEEAGDIQPQQLMTFERNGFAVVE